MRARRWDPTSARLGAAAGLGLAPLGLVWSVAPGTVTPGVTLSGVCGAYYCTSDVSVPGSYFAGRTTLVSESPVRVFLVFAALLLAWAAAGRRTPVTRRVARAATGLLAVAAVLALAHRHSVVFVAAAVALALAAPPVWRGAAVFGGRRIPG